MTTTTTYQQPNAQGYYGKFGGAFIPEMLHRNVEELKSKYLDIIYDPGFQKEFTGIFHFQYQYLHGELLLQFWFEPRVPATNPPGRF